MSKVAYVAGPIDLVTEAERNLSWTALKGLLTEHGYVIYNPLLAWTATLPDRFTAQRLWRVNELARVGADLVVGILPASAHSIGVPAELALSIEERKEVVVISDHTKSWMLEAWNRELRQAGRGGVFKTLRELDLHLSTGDGKILKFVGSDEEEIKRIGQVEGFDEPEEGK